jgi:uncharacterized protein YbjT (DUF2867 family)
VQLPLVTVLGATGKQGGGLIKAALARPSAPYRFRAVTRKPDAPAARQLAERGVEIVHADLDDPVSLQRAFENTHGVFAVTNFWEHLSPDTELRQARHIAQASARAGVAHVIWSTLEDIRQVPGIERSGLPTLMGKYKVPHYDAKGEANAFFRAAGVPTTFLYTSFYWDNLIDFGMAPRRLPDGGLGFVLPMGDRKLPGIAAADIGPCALALFERGVGTAGQEVGVAGGHLTGAQMARALGEVLGEPVRHVSPSFEEYAGYGFPGAADLANMFHFKHDFEALYCSRRPLDRTRELHPGTLDFAGWLQRRRDALRGLVPPASA